MPRLGFLEGGNRKKLLMIRFEQGTLAKAMSVDSPRVDTGISISEILPSGNKATSASHTILDTDANDAICA